MELRSIAAMHHLEFHINWSIVSQEEIEKCLCTIRNSYLVIQGLSLGQLLIG